MARIDLDDEKLHVRLSPLDRVLAFSGDVHVRRDHVVAARAVPNARRAVEARIRVLGTAAPGLVTAGEMGALTGGGTTFAVTYGNRPGIVIDLHDDAAWQHLVVTLPDAPTLAMRLTSVLE